MRALLIAAAAGVALIGLTGCGQDTGQDAGSDAAGTPTTTSTTDRTTEPKPTPATPVPSVTDVTPRPEHPKSADPPSDAPPPGPPSTPVSLSPTGPVVPAGVEQVPAAQVDASALPEYHDHRGKVWVYDGGYSLQMFALATSGCGDAEARLVDQSASEVRIVLRALPQPQGGPPDGEICTAVMTPRPVTVRLDAPLGDRMIRLAAGR